MLRKLRENWAIPVMGITGGVLVGIVSLVPQRQTQQIQDIARRIAAENSARQTLIQFIGGSFFFLTAYISLETLKATQRNVKATEEKQIAERFSKAVELLAHESIHVRLGGIYALEKIANSEDSYYWQIMETLSAYVREKRRRTSSRFEENHPDASSWLERMHNWFCMEYDPPLLPTDVQAALNVLGNRKYYYESDKEPYRLNLYRSDLEQAHLYGLKNLTGVNLQEANLSFAVLPGANLQNADLRGAILCRANLQGADFRGANLQRAILVGANLRGAKFKGANLHGADLAQANLRRYDYAAEIEADQDLEVDLREVLGLEGEQFANVFWDDGTLITDDLRQSLQQVWQQAFQQQQLKEQGLNRM